MSRVLNENDWVWLKDDRQCFVPAQSTEKFEAGKQAATFTKEGGEKISIEAPDTAHMEAIDPQVLDFNIDNLLVLTQLNEAGILHNLRIRFKEDLMYTKMSDILLAVNPFKELPIFDRKTIELYKNSGGSSLPPHIFDVASRAFKQMQADNTPQSIVISGESGAGKTETTKMALKFIAEATSRQVAATDKPNTKGLESRLIQANPLIEAFGNAKTSRNDNSSRFGKLLSVYFDGSGAMTGTRVIPYLLEKSRVVGLQQGERNYHIFYQLLAGRSQLPSSLEPSLRLPDSPQKFNYLAKSGVFTSSQSESKRRGSSIRMGDDVQGLAEVLKAMKDVLELKEEEQGFLFKCLAGVLHLGNVQFTEDSDDGSKLCEGEAGAIPLATAAALLGVEEDRLARAVMSKNIGNHSVIVVPLNPETAGITRDTLAKAVYSIMFDWIVARFNDQLGGAQTAGGRGGGGCEKALQKSISVLDIFGFEALTVNSLEQLCINYCNEKLQHFFMSYAVSMELEEYKREGLAIDANFDITDNSSILKLLESPPTESCPSGLLPMLDEELELLKTTDHTYLERVLNRHETHAHLFRAKASAGGKREAASADRERDESTGRLSEVRDCFVVLHYAGKVEYDTTGWLDKNRDRLAPGVAELLSTSTHPLLAAAGEQEVNRECKTSTSGGRVVRHSRSRSNASVGEKLNTLGFKFRGQLEDLLDTLQNSSAHFVRCIKPNQKKVCDEFESPMVLQQLRDTGLLGVCLIRQRGLRRLLQDLQDLVPECEGSQSAYCGARAAGRSQRGDMGDWEEENLPASGGAPDY